MNGSNAFREALHTNGDSLEVDTVSHRFIESILGK